MVPPRARMSATSISEGVRFSETENRPRFGDLHIVEALRAADDSVDGVETRAVAAGQDSVRFVFPFVTTMAILLSLRPARQSALAPPRE